MRTHALRLRPGDEIKSRLQAYVRDHEIKACFILACIGSASRGELRLANATAGSAENDVLKFDSPTEIVSLQASFSLDGCHMHTSLADATGATIGGHVLSLVVHTTAEIVLGDISEQYRFRRAQDPATGYKELVIEPSRL